MYVAAFTSCWPAKRIACSLLLGDQAEEDIGGLPATELHGVACYRSVDVRVAVAVAAHLGGKFYRHEVHQQLHAERIFYLFVQLSQKGGQAFP